MSATMAVFLISLLGADGLGPGDHVRTLKVDGRNRSALIHVPVRDNPDVPAPLVLILHGARTNAAIMAAFTQMNAKADEAGFMAVYPNGTGTDPLLYWNAGQRTAQIVRENPDDVKFIRLLLDDLATVLKIDARRVYATGMSNGGTMCYRLAAELPNRIAAIAPVAGTMVFVDRPPPRPMPVMHFHGTADAVVKYGGRNDGALAPVRSVDETIEYWRRANKCEEPASVSELPNRHDDGTRVRKSVSAPKAGSTGAEVILYTIEGGGHTWPGQEAVLPSLGKSTRQISANDLMWEFFQKQTVQSP